MNHVFKTINQYHSLFESYDQVHKLTNFRVWLVIVCLSGFLISAYAALGFTFELLPLPFGDTKSAFIACIIFEVIGLIAFAALNSQKEQQVLKQSAILMKSDLKHLTDYKKLWLKNHVGYEPCEYGDLIKLIDDNLEIRKKNKPTFALSRTDIANAFFTSDAKPRIYALLLAIASTILALSIKNGSTIEDVFKFFDGPSIGQLFLICLFLALFLLLTAAFIKKCVHVLWLCYDILCAKIDGEYAISELRAKIFMRELVKYQEIKKPRVRIEPYSETSNIEAFGTNKSTTTQK